MDRSKETGSVQKEVTQQRGLRVLFVTQDASILSRESASYTRILALRPYFSEIHVLVLNTSKQTQESATIRITENIWFYITYSKGLFTHFQMFLDGYRLIAHELAYVHGFRPDVMVSLDAELSLPLCYLLSEKKERPYKVILLEGFEDGALGTIRSMIQKFCIERADMILLGNTAVFDFVHEITHVQSTRMRILPVYYDHERWRQNDQESGVPKLFPQYTGCVMHYSSMRTEARTEVLIRAFKEVHASFPHVGLVIIGDGPRRNEFVNLVISLGIHKNVVFVSKKESYIETLSEAQVFVHLAPLHYEHELLLEVSSLKIPSICANDGFGADIFTHDVSAKIVPPDDVATLARTCKELLGDNNDRHRLALEAEHAIREYMSDDYNAYIENYATLIIDGISPKL